MEQGRGIKTSKLEKKAKEENNKIGINKNQNKECKGEKIDKQQTNERKN